LGESFNKKSCSKQYILSPGSFPGFYTIPSYFFRAENQIQGLIKFFNRFPFAEWGGGRRVAESPRYKTAGRPAALSEAAPAFFFGKLPLSSPSSSPVPAITLSLYLSHALWFSAAAA
jgi:hypothetical protein